MRSAKNTDSKVKDHLGGRLTRFSTQAQQNVVNQPHDAAEDDAQEHPAADDDILMTDVGSSPGAEGVADIEQPVESIEHDVVEQEIEGTVLEWSGSMGSSVPPPPDSDLSGSESGEETLIDADELRDADIDEVIAQAVRSDVPLEDVLGAGGYEDCIVVAVDPQPFDDDEEEEEGGPTPIYPRVEGDTSKLVPMRQNKSIEMTDLEVICATYADLTGLSRDGWEMFREVLFSIRDDFGNIPRMIQSLPKQLSTLRRHMRDRMPMMHMREADIPLDILKLPTLPASLKPEERRKIEILRQRYDLKKAASTADKAARLAARLEGKNSEEARRLAKAADRARERVDKLKKDYNEEEDLDLNGPSGPALPVVTTPLTFFDPPTLFKNIVASDIGKRAHSGPGHFVDMPREFFESDAWLSSIRTTSGRYAHIILEDGEKGPAIFPNDWIFYRCTKERCPLVCRAVPDDRVHVDAHVGRVYGVGLDRRRKPCTTDTEQLCLRVQEAYKRGAVGLQAFNIEQEARELILTAKFTYIPESMAFAHVDVHTDYCYGEDHRDPSSKPAQPRLNSKRQPKQSIPFPKYDSENPIIQHPWDKEMDYYMVRRMISGQNIIPMCYTNPTRAELELDHFTRDVFEHTWDQDREGSMPVISFPHIDFINGFGIFRNSYRSLMGFYFTPAGLTVDERMRPKSIFPLVLGPHGSKFGDVTKALKTMTKLDEGMVMDIPGKGKVILCAFAMCYTGDMPQQAENCGFKGPRGTKFCRCCFTSNQVGRAGDRDPDAQINFDVVAHGRFHFQVMEMQQHMARLNQSNAIKYGTQWGFNTPFPALVDLSPALDIVMSRPPDAAHSEFNGVAQLIHELFYETILTAAGKREYAVLLRSWPFPPGWQRLQSVYNHFLSWQMVDYGRWLIISPAMLLHWLKKDRINKKFYARTEAETGRNPVEVIVETLARLAKSAALLMGTKVSRHDRRKLSDIVYEARLMFNRLHVFASASILDPSVAPSVAGSQGSQSAAGTGGSTPTDSQADEIIVDTAGNDEIDDPASVKIQGSKRAKQYDTDTLRPNVHLGIHYEAFAKEYGLPVNCNTLTGEDMHREFKRRVYETNYSNIEKILLMKINFQQTMRLMLLNAFTEDDPEMTTRVKELNRQCPVLFGRVLSHSDRSQLEEADIELEVEQSRDENHLAPSIVNRIKGITSRHVANEGQRLPQRSTFDEMTARWSRLLRHAYHYDYGAPMGEPSFFENKIIKWAEKFGFTDSTTRRRFVFKCGDYIQYLSRSDTPRQYRIGRVDHIFQQQYYTTTQIFIVITPVRRTNTRNPILDLEIMEELTDEPVIIGLTAVQPVSLYMVHVDGVGIVWVDWDIYTL